MSAEANTRIKLADPKSAFEHLVSHLAEDGLEPEPVSRDWVRFRRMGCEVNFRYSAEELSVDLSAPSRSLLYFLKEAAALHVVQFDPLSADRIRWSDAEDADSQPVNLTQLTLRRSEEVLPGMIRLTLAGAEVGSLAGEGIHVKLMLPADRSRAPVWPTVGSNGVTKWPQGEDRLHVRYFTIRHLRIDAGEVDIDVVQHKGGMISDWARDASPGEVIGVMGPGGGDFPEQHRGLLLSGDETALPAIARILEEIGHKAEGHAVIAFPDSVDPGTYLPETQVTLHTIPPASFRNEIERRIALISAEFSIRQAWFGGEHANAQALRRFFKKEKALKKGAQLSVSYWREGVRGHAEREEH